MKTKIQGPDWLKPSLWGAAVGVVAVAIVGFGAGWIVTSGTAHEMVEREVEKAIVSSLTPICVAQFKEETDQRALLASLQKENHWDRPEFVEKHGWATMPGSSEPNDEITAACAAELLQIADTTSR
jgi:hypothetical protein